MRWHGDGRTLTGVASDVSRDVDCHVRLLSCAITHVRIHGQITVSDEGSQKVVVGVACTASCRGSNRCVPRDCRRIGNVAPVRSVRHQERSQGERNVVVDYAGDTGRILGHCSTVRIEIAVNVSHDRPDRSVDLDCAYS